ncbi:hypothetical protein PSE10B_41230 [Pseudomonas amygdali pv. eriobotryae]|nr:hypothetical protein PSE10B_41230 [Pseudomonas amygdali pv. eriobotryae]
MDIPDLHNLHILCAGPFVHVAGLCVVITKREVPSEISISNASPALSRYVDNAEPAAFGDKPYGQHFL